jgi:hypothetical protein
MSTLGRRLDMLEQLTEDVRRHEMRELVGSLPEAHDLTAEEMEAAVTEGLRVLDELRSVGR